VLAAGLGLGGCAGTRDSASLAAERHEAGRALYNYRCYYCHGYSGNARTAAAAVLRPPPRDFTRASPDELSVGRIERAVRDGVAGSAMPSFARTLTPEEIGTVAAFVHREFVRDKAPNTRYHTAKNGWPNHERYAEAFPFARGELAVDPSERTLDEAQRRGQRLFLSACITCHEPAQSRAP
jgi:cytochrome c oxidase cbb3-type subunit 3